MDKIRIRRSPSLSHSCWEVLRPSSGSMATTAHCLQGIRAKYSKTIKFKKRRQFAINTQIKIPRSRLPNSSLATTKTCRTKYLTSNRAFQCTLNSRRQKVEILTKFRKRSIPTKFMTHFNPHRRNTLNSMLKNRPVAKEGITHHLICWLRLKTQ